jgi:xylulokinase
MHLRSVRRGGERSRGGRGEGDPTVVLIGIDLGTTNLKGIAVRPDGRQVAAATRPTPIHYHGTETADFYPEELFAATWTLVRELVAHCPAPEQIAGLGVSSLAEAGVALDAQGAPLGPSIAWFDHRPRELVAHWRARVDAKEVFRITGLQINHIPSLGKLLWEQHHRPEVTRRRTRWLFLPSYLIFRLTGEVATDYSLASRSMLFDVRTRRWSARMCDLASVPMEVLPPAFPSGTAVGVVRDQLADELGLRRGVPVVLGGHDHLCGAFSAGLRRRGEILGSAGTTDTLCTLVDPGHLPDAFFEAGLNCGCHVAGEDNYLLGGVHTAGKLIDWYLETFAPTGGTADQRYDRLIAEAAAAPVGSHGLVVVPHLRGCPTPHNDPVAKGAFLGVRTTHTRHDLARALFEGLTFDLKTVLDTFAAVTGHAFPEVKYIGGGSRNRFWMQLKADVLDRTMCVSRLQENASLGAALLAGIGAGVYRTPEDALAAVHRDEDRMLPHSDTARAYRKIYDEVYRGLYSRMRPINQDLESLH